MNVEVKNNKKYLIYLIIAVIFLIIVVAGATFAYFVAQVNNVSETSVNVTTASQTDVYYTPGEDLSLVNGEPGDSASTTANIVLTSSNGSNDSVNYGIDIVISENDFVYDLVNTTDSQLKAILSYSTDGENYTDLEDVVDLTEKTGTVTLISNQVLSALASETSEVTWKVTIEYPSYNYNQANNMEKTFHGTIVVTGLE